VTDDLAAARRALRETFGFETFREGQAEALEAVLAGSDALAVMPTGSGKSLLYQLPAAMGRGLVVVASPLISLMRDQLRALAAIGLPAAALHSAQSEEDAAEAVSLVRSGRARLLYAAPERLALEGTQTLLRGRTRLFVVDEAHCVSHWGHDFRPDYAALGAIARTLGDPPILAVTATAGPRTREDIVRLLFARAPRMFLRSFARDNLALAFRRRRDALAQIADFGRGRGPGIVYCGSRHKTMAFAERLRARGADALPYHAGLDSVARGLNQDAFFTRPDVVMVATIAFGMGVDKPDVRFVAHADLPGSVEGYYQEIGRAGRDGLPAAALALYDPRELAMRLALPGADETQAAAETGRRKAMARLCVTPGCRFTALLAAFGEDSAPCGRCDHCRGGLLAAPRRIRALADGWRAGLEARLLAHAPDNAAAEPAPKPADIDQLYVDVAREVPLRAGDEKRLRALTAARLACARRRGVAPRHVAGEEQLRALATGVVLPQEAGLEPEDAATFAAALAPAD